MGIAIFFRTWWQGCLVGEDAQGNKYYEDKKVMRYGKPRRWVVYKGRAEASKVPAGWHGWLHYATPELPKLSESYPWEKEHLPNLTGTPYAHQCKKAEEVPLKKGYEAWTPIEKN